METTSNAANTLTVKVWRKYPSKAKHPLCTLTAFVLSTGRSGWWFRSGQPRRDGYHVSDEAAAALLARHAAIGNRIEESTEGEAP